MIMLGHFLIAVATILHSIIGFLYIIMIGYVIISWVNADPYNPIVRFINGLSEPICGYIRRFVPPIGVLDISPLIAFFGLVFIDSFLVGSMISYGSLLVRQAGGVING